MNTAPICSWCSTNQATGYHQEYPICTQCFTQLFPQVPAEPVSVFPYQQPSSQFSPDLQTIDNLGIAGSTRLCRRCSCEVSNTVITCPNCSYTELDLVSAEAWSAPVSAPKPITLVTTNPCWKCECGYEYNRYEACEKCKRPKEVEETKGAEPRVTPIVIDQGNGSKPKKASLREEAKIAVAQAVCTECSLDTGLKLWGCSKGHGFNFETDKCCRVCEESNPRDPVVQNPSYRSIADLPIAFEQLAACEWECFSCNRRSRGKTECNKCKCPRTWQGYLQFKKLGLNAAQTKWQCPSCQTENDLVVGNCQKCRKPSSPILKWTKNERPPEESFWWRICGC